MFNDAAKAMMRGYVSDTLPLEEMLSVKGKVAIVTGSNSGLGFCIAQRLCQGGAKVVITGSDSDKGEFSLELLKEKGYDAAFCKADVRSEQEVEELVNFTAETYGTVDILVTSAGRWSFGHVYDLPEAEFKDVIDINLTGTFRCVKHVSKYMVEHNVKGKIVLIASNSAYLTYPLFGGYPHYVASKGGVQAMGQELAKELKRYGIMVNVVAPGPMLTPPYVQPRVPAAAVTTEQMSELRKEIAATHMDGVPTADSVAIVAYGLCTRMADGMTGETVVVDSGMMRNIVSHQRAMPAYPPQE